jgi:hypothetical protein
MGQVFLYHLEVENGEFHFVMQFVGPKELELEYHYEVMMCTEHEMILVKNVVRSIEEEFDAIFSSGKCVSLNLKTIKNFLSESDELDFEVKVIFNAESKESNCCSLM